MHKHKFRITKNQKHILQFWAGIMIGAVIIFIYTIYYYHKQYENRVYPGITINHISFSGATFDQVTQIWLEQNQQFKDLKFTFRFENQIATLSGRQLDIGYDATLSATQALSVGRNRNILTDTYQKYQGLTTGINLDPLFRWNEEPLMQTLHNLSQNIDIEAENALFEFTNGRVSVFKLSKPGRFLDIDEIKQNFINTLNVGIRQKSSSTQITFALPVKPKKPAIDNEQANGFGITELIGRGQSFFQGSIPGRIHNVALAASRINGALILPGETFSFNATVGDISAATGYKQAYVIKSGRTVLDDGGGVCQVSTTLFRTALNSGLPIVERHAHSYRVGYYEQGGWKPGFDATVYAPSYDLKIKNDTPTHILIQAVIDTANTHLIFEMYGKKDGRTQELSPVRLWDYQPAPPSLYQDDPTLPAGVIKQVDWSNPGIKAAFDYSVKRDNQELFKTTFFSNFVPWQAVFLKGTKTN